MTARAALHGDLARLAADEAGLEAGAVDAVAIERFVARSVRTGTSLAELRRGALARDALLVEALLSAVLVGETFFFRDPEHFRLVRDVIAARPGPARLGLAGWSAGCASGEEAYSLAATLLAVTRDPARVSVLATDVHEQALEVARKATYKRSSLRPSGPLLHPVLGPADKNGLAHVLDEVRGIVMFQHHDLRDAAPSAARFDLIVCRNVLVYFARDVARQVGAHLTAALAPDGVLVFGAMDIEATELPRLARIGRAEHQTFQLPAPRAQRPPARAATSDPAPRVDRAAQAIEAHRAALVLVERGRRQDAARALRELVQRHPEYLPGLLERALFDARHGDVPAANERMRAVLEAAERLPGEQLVAGVEELPASFYAASAREFLRRQK